MKKIITLMVLLATAPMSMHAEIGSWDVAEYVKILLQRDARCLQLEITRKQRNLSTTKQNEEIKECQKVAQLLEAYTQMLDRFVADAHSNPFDDQNPFILFHQPNYKKGYQTIVNVKAN